MKVLHFAPERIIASKIRAINAKGYITADISVGRADVVEDITKISYPDSSFDYIICNHVLEHVEEEEKAFSELRRCIKPNGKIIFSVPICWEKKTVEDDSINTPEKRLVEYGQEDHVRLYGYDIKERLEKYGFCVDGYCVQDVLSREEIKRMSLIPEDTVWILQLP